MKQLLLRFGAIVVAAMWPAMTAAAKDWLQFQENAAHHGRAAEAVAPPYQLRWVWYGEDNVVVARRPLAAGKVPRPPRDTVGLLSFTMHAIVADERVIFGDLQGKLFCLNSRDGSTIWQRQFPGAFVHAAAVHKPSDDPLQNRIVVACQDGKLYGLNWDGQVRWSVAGGRPFVTPPTISDATVYCGGLDGTLSAIAAETGAVRWRFDAGAAIRQPAAVAGGRVYFGAENMIFYALDAASGRLLWKTAPGQLTGQSFRNTWPVVVGDKVMTFQILVDGMAEYVMEALLFNATPGDHRQKRLEDWPLEREAILKWLAGDMTYAVDCGKYWQDDAGAMRPEKRSLRWAGGPQRKTLYVFTTEGDGNGGAVEPYQVPMGIVGGTGNANMGPVLDALGRPITWWRVSARSIITGGSFGTAFSPDLSALNLETGDRIILPTERDIHQGGPGMELDNHHMLTAAGEYLFYHNPFRQARWIKLNGTDNPNGQISAVFGQHDGGGWSGDVVYYTSKEDAGLRGDKIFDTHGAARTPIVVADQALFVNELDIRALACYESVGTQGTRNGPEKLDAEPLATAQDVVPSKPLDEHIRAARNDPADWEDYVWQKRSIGALPAAAEPIRQEIVRQVERLIDAGHLQPYFAKRGELNARWYFTNPGDLIGILGRVAPYLPADLQSRVRSYLKQEMSLLPPWSDRLNSPTEPGTPRQVFEIPEHVREWNRGRMYAALPRVHNIYSIWSGLDLINDDALLTSHWEEICSFYDSKRADVDTYLGGVSAPIGLARLARQVGDQKREKRAVQDALAALQTIDQEPTWRTPMLRRYGFQADWVDDFNFAGFHLLSLVPEVARYIRDHDAIRESMTAHVARGTDHWPMWFLSQGSGFSRYYGESHALSPLYSAMIFPIKALVEQQPPERLQRYVDAEDAPIGDLFFLERLLLTLEAHGQESWIDVR